MSEAYQNEPKPVYPSDHLAAVIFVDGSDEKELREIKSKIKPELESKYAFQSDIKFTSWANDSTTCDWDVWEKVGVTNRPMIMGWDGTIYSPSKFFEYAEGLQSTDFYLYAFGKEDTLEFFLNLNDGHVVFVHDGETKTEAYSKKDLAMLERLAMRCFANITKNASHEIDFIWENIPFKAKEKLFDEVMANVPHEVIALPKGFKGDAPSWLSNNYTGN